MAGQIRLRMDNACDVTRLNRIGSKMGHAAHLSISISTGPICAPRKFSRYTPTTGDKQPTESWGVARLSGLNGLALRHLLGQGASTLPGGVQQRTHCRRSLDLARIGVNPP